MFDERTDFYSYRRSIIISKHYLRGMLESEPYINKTLPKHLMSDSCCEQTLTEVVSSMNLPNTCNWNKDIIKTSMLML